MAWGHRRWTRSTQTQLGIEMDFLYYLSEAVVCGRCCHSRELWDRGCQYFPLMVYHRLIYWSTSERLNRWPELLQDCFCFRQCTGLYLLRCQCLEFCGSRARSVGCGQEDLDLHGEMESSAPRWTTRLNWLWGEIMSSWIDCSRAGQGRFSPLLERLAFAVVNWDDKNARVIRMNTFHFSNTFALQMLECARCFIARFSCVGSTMGLASISCQNSTQYFQKAWRTCFVVPSVVLQRLNAAAASDPMSGYLLISM